MAKVRKLCCAFQSDLSSRDREDDRGISQSWFLSHNVRCVINSVVGRSLATLEMTSVFQARKASQSWDEAVPEPSCRTTAAIHSTNVSSSFSWHWAFAFVVGTNIAV